MKLAQALVSLLFLNTLVGRQKKELLPEDVSDMSLANNFLASFENKSNDIRAHTSNNENEIRHLPDISICKLNKFEEVTLTDMKDTLRKANKTL